MKKILPIVEKRKIYFSISATVLIIGILFIIINAAMGNGAFNLDVEFSGGASFLIDLEKDFNNDDIAAIVSETTGQTAPQVQRVLGTNQVSIRVRSLDTTTRDSLINKIIEQYSISKDNFEYSDISATVSSDMQRAAVLAIIVASILMLIYISFRFHDISIGSSAILCLLHDALITIAFYAILRVPLNYSFIAAILTILGYSINATIIGFDRIRENRPIMLRKVGLAELINTSITQTVRRSLFTSITTLLVILLLYIFGVSSIKQFTLPIMLGLIAGTYSSIFLSGNFWYLFSKKTVAPAVSNTTTSSNSNGSKKRK